MKKYTQKKERKKRKTRRTVYQKQKKQKKKGVFLNCYDFAYAGRDTVNQATKVALGVTKSAGNKINNIIQQRIN